MVLLGNVFCDHWILKRLLGLKLQLNAGNTLKEMPHHGGIDTNAMC